MIAPQFIDPHVGLRPEQQLRAFVEAAHLLQMAVGFNLLPHVAQFAIPVLLYSELFRWIKLTRDRTALDGGRTTDEILQPVWQGRIAARCVLLSPCSCMPLVCIVWKLRKMTMTSYGRASGSVAVK